MKQRLLATYHALGAGTLKRTEDSGAAEEDGEASRAGPCLDHGRQAFSSRSLGLSDDDDEKYSEEEATGVPREQEEFMGGQPAPLPSAF